MRIATRGLIALACSGALTVLGLSAVVAAGQPVGAVPTANSVTRLCSATPKQGFAACMALRQTHPIKAAAPAAAPSGYGPADLQAAYNLDASGGAGQTVAIVDAHDDPNAEADLATYRSHVRAARVHHRERLLPKVNQQRPGITLPRRHTGWAGEISLDLDMVSAVCPNCHILLVEADQPTTDDLGHSREHRGRRSARSSSRTATAAARTAPRRPMTPVLQSPRRRRSRRAPATAASVPSYPATCAHVTLSAARRSADTRRHAAGARRHGTAPAAAARSTSPSRAARRSTPAARTAPRPTCRRSPTPPPASPSTTPTGTGLERVRRHERIGADHRVGLRAGRHAGRIGFAGLLPVRSPRRAQRRHVRQQRRVRCPALRTPAPAGTARPDSARRTGRGRSPRRRDTREWGGHFLGDWPPHSPIRSSAIRSSASRGRLVAGRACAPYAAVRVARSRRRCGDRRRSSRRTSRRARRR